MSYKKIKVSTTLRRTLIKSLFENRIEMDHKDTPEIRKQQVNDAIIATVGVLIFVFNRMVNSTSLDEIYIS